MIAQILQKEIAQAELKPGTNSTTLLSEKNKTEMRKFLTRLNKKFYSELAKETIKTKKGKKKWKVGFKIEDNENETGKDKSVLNLKGKTLKNKDEKNMGESIAPMNSPAIKVNNFCRRV